MDKRKLRWEFENHPKFKGMDFARSTSHPDYYESPYANGAWEGYEAASVKVVQVAHCERPGGCVCGGDTKAIRETCGYWFKV